MKGKGLMIMLGGPKKDDDADDAAPAADYSKEAKELAAGDLIRAVKSGDKAAVVAAYEAMRDACGGGMEPDDEEAE